jgi:hypothetical protein
MLDYEEERAMGKLALERLSKLHGRGRLDVPPWMYQRWLECFIDTLWKVDPEMSATLATAWRRALTPGIALMTEAHRASGEGERMRS